MPPPSEKGAGGLSAELTGLTSRWIILTRWGGVKPWARHSQLESELVEPARRDNYRANARHLNGLPLESERAAACRVGTFLVEPSPAGIGII